MKFVKGKKKWKEMEEHKVSERNKWSKHMKCNLGEIANQEHSRRTDTAGEQIKRGTNARSENSSSDRST
jgi:hypothetical protein